MRSKVELSFVQVSLQLLRMVEMKSPRNSKVYIPGLRMKALLCKLSSNSDLDHSLFLMHSDVQSIHVAFHFFCLGCENLPKLTAGSQEHLSRNSGSVGQWVYALDKCISIVLLFNI